MILDTKQMLYTAAIGMLIALWSQVKALASRALALVLVECEFMDDSGIIVSTYINSQDSGFKRFNGGIRVFSAFSFRNKIKNKKQNYGFELFTGSFTMLTKNKKPIFVRNNGLIREMRSSIKIRFIRFTFDMDQIYKSAIDHFNNIQKDKNNRFAIYNIHGVGNRGATPNDKAEVAHDSSEINERRSFKLLYSKWDEIGYTDDSENIDSLALTTQAEKAIDELRLWKDNESWFRKRSIPWKTGWLLYGLPGTGKTSLIRCCGKALDMPIYCYDLASMNNKELIERWKDMLSTAPCIALLEDIDTIFDGRTNISGIQGGGLTFDCLLNVLDGVTPNDGLFLAVTTNRVEKLDPALGVPTNGHSTRPGRIDKAICMAPPDDAGRTKIATRILSDWKHVIPSIVSEGEKDTGAQFQNRCCELALKLYWTKGA